jgi:coenzyme F420-reducing hydrogenase delta subunit
MAELGKATISLDDKTIKAIREFNEAVTLLSVSIEEAARVAKAAKEFSDAVKRLETVAKEQKEFRLQ